MTPPAPLDDRTDALRRALYSPTSTAADLSAYAAALGQRTEVPGGEPAVDDGIRSDGGRSDGPALGRCRRRSIGGAVVVVSALALVAGGFALGRSTGGPPSAAATSALAATPVPATQQDISSAALVFTRAQAPGDRPDPPLGAKVIPNSVRLIADRRSVGVSLYAALRTDGRIALLATTLQQQVFSASAPPPTFAIDGLALRFTVTTDPIDDAGSGARTAVRAEWRPDGTVEITPTQR